MIDEKNMKELLNVGPLSWSTSFLSTSTSSSVLVLVSSWSLPSLYLASDIEKTQARSLTLSFSPTHSPSSATLPYLTHKSFFPLFIFCKRSNLGPFFCKVVLGLSGKMRVCACVSVCVLDGERERVRERMRGCKCDSSSTVFFLLVLLLLLE